MRKYYLFVIRKEFSRVYRNNTDILYKTLENLYYIKSENYNYGISLYKQLCHPFNVNILNNKFNYPSLIREKKQKYSYQRKYEKVVIKINYSCCIILTSVNFPIILKIFDNYSKDIFICDFENKDYFWLSKQYNKKRFYEYNLL